MDHIEDLERWVASGARWQVIHRGPDQVLIALLTCTLNEEAGRITSDDPALLAWLGDRTSSDDANGE
ncbi:MAG: hypothetical protein Q4G46_07430 [Propionibacteriaceae bacterium]|nr:hypothetical protein [Propionibacteriaceae bacterium]